MSNTALSQDLKYLVLPVLEKVHEGAKPSPMDVAFALKVVRDAVKEADRG